MKKHFEILRKCPLFNNIADNDLSSLLSCFDAKAAIFNKKDIILSEGEYVTHIGIVLSGKAQLERTDYYGNRSIVTSIFPAELFGEAFACSGSVIPFDIVASESTEILLIDCKKITSGCSNACGFHNQMIFNLLKVVATKNVLLNQKAEITSKRTTREKLLTYLYLQSKKVGTGSFTIPYDRQELADFLEVDRSGLSAEISKLRSEKILESRKNHFKLL